MKLNQSQLVNETSAVVLSGGRRTTAENVRILLGDVFDSVPNLVDGGFKFDAQIGYSSPIALTNPLAFATVQFVLENSSTFPYIPLDANGSIVVTGAQNWGSKAILNLGAINNEYDDGFNVSYTPRVESSTVFNYQKVNYPDPSTPGQDFLIVETWQDTDGHHYVYNATAAGGTAASFYLGPGGLSFSSNQLTPNVSFRSTNVSSSQVVEWPERSGIAALISNNDQFDQWQYDVDLAPSANLLYNEITDIYNAMVDYDSTAVHITGDESIAGVKTFTDPISTGSIKVLKFGGSPAVAGDYLPFVQSLATTDLLIGDATVWSSISLVSATQINLNSGTDKPTVIGRGSLGIQPGQTNTFALGHSTAFSSTGYGFRQTTGGITTLNAATASSIDFRIGNVQKIILGTSSLTVQGSTYVINAPIYNLLDNDGSTNRTVLTASATTGRFTFGGAGWAVDVPSTVWTFTGASTSVTSTGTLTLQTSTGGASITVGPVGGSVVTNGVTITRTTTAMSHSSGTARYLTISGTFGAANNSASQDAFAIINTITTTGTNSGVLTGLNINPSLTLVSTSTYYAIRSQVNVSGTGASVYNIYADGTAPSAHIGSFSFGSLVANSNAFVTVGASTTAKAQLNLITGVAPTLPNDGDIWFDGSNIKMQIGGITKTFTLL